MFHTTTNYQPYLHQMVITWTQDDQGKKQTTVQFDGKTIDIDNLIENEDKNLKTPQTMVPSPSPSPSPMAYPRRVVDFDDEKSVDKEDAPVLMEADTNKTSVQQTFINDLKQHWTVSMETPDTMLITPTPNSLYADFPSKINTHDLYHRPIYHYMKKWEKKEKVWRDGCWRKNEVWRGYWINKESLIADVVRGK